MQVNEIMTPNVQCIDPEATVEEAARIMQSMDIGSILVCEDDQLLGIVTDRDIVLRSVAESQPPADTPVREVMSNRLFFCYEDEDVDQTAFRMKEKQVRRLPVLDADRHLVGIVSLGDIAVGSTNEQVVGEALSGVSEPDRYQRCNILLAEE